MTDDIYVLFVERNFPFDLEFLVFNTSGRRLALTAELTTSQFEMPQGCKKKMHNFQGPPESRGHLLFNVCRRNREKYRFCENETANRRWIEI